MTVHRPIYKYDNKFTVMLAVWGQFIDHDITATALTQGENGKPISCCPDNLHPECFSVITNDSFYESFNVTCLDFVRSAPVQTNTLGPREQLNQVSAFFDGSVIYGNDKNVSNQLRSFEGGKLKVYVTPDNRTLLPLSKDPNDGCNEDELNKIGKYCFVTGKFDLLCRLALTDFFPKAIKERTKIYTLPACISFGCDSTTNWLRSLPH